MLVLPHTPSVEPSRSDVWSADSENSTLPILAFVAPVLSARSYCTVFVSSATLASSSFAVQPLREISDCTRETLDVVRHRLALCDLFAVLEQ